MMRINKYLAWCGVASRRAVEQFIKDGRVKLNGQVVADLATQIDEAKDRLQVDDHFVLPPRKEKYIILHKPKGYFTTAQDEKGRKTVLELVDVRERLFPVGRLDAKSEGLLLLTTDGELAHRLMHPRYKVWKTYRVTLTGNFAAKDFHPLTTGLELEDGWTAPCEAGFYSENRAQIQIKIREGRNQQLRRMFAALGYEVKTLKRTEYGPLSLTGIERGKWRELSPQELKILRKAAGLQRSS
jgi:23S rRNA pseudouridine2605 synthase